MKAFSLKKVGKVVLIGTAALIVVVQVVKFAWTMSGSHEWELEIERDGIKVYSFKAPGSYVKRFKGVTRAGFTPRQIIAALTLENHILETCKEWIPTCMDLEVVEPYTAQAQGDTILWKLEGMPPVIKNTEYLITMHTEQDRKTGVIAVDVMAAANKLPLHDCCLRSRHLHNRWQITPLANGQVDIQLIQDFSLPGFLPDFLVNMTGATETYKLFQRFPELFGKERHQNVSIDYIREVP